MSSEKKAVPYGTVGTHNGDKSRARAITVKNPNAKVEKRRAIRKDDWERTAHKLRTKGRQKPGSQRKSRCE